VKEKQTLSFEADSSDHLQDTYVVETGGMRLLKLALIYGANATGKTTIIKALDFLRHLVLNPKVTKNEGLGFKPFMFDSNTPQENSVLSLEFVQKEIRYYYEVEFTQEAIVKEILNNYNPTKANVFKRETDLANQYTEISFGSKIKKDRSIEKALEANTLWNDTVLGGFLKTNINIDELREVIDWFRIHLMPIVLPRTGLESYISQRINQGTIDKSLVISILKKADLHISDIILKNDPKYDSDRLVVNLSEKVEEPSEELKQFFERRKSRFLIAEFEHVVNDQSYMLPLDSESQGTKRYYGFAGLLALLIKESCILPVDELEASLHPDLFQHFLISFLINSKHSQLIATTHYRELLDNKDIFRNDAIWFTHKEKDCATNLYSLADFDSSVIRNTTNILNAYKSGKLRGTPNLGDYYID
jgi:AAA15 family ATPase/GTPase